MSNNKKPSSKKTIATPSPTHLPPPSLNRERENEPEDIYLTPEEREEILADQLAIEKRNAALKLQEENKKKKYDPNPNAGDMYNWEKSKNFPDPNQDLENNEGDKKKSEEENSGRENLNNGERSSATGGQAEASGQERGGGQASISSENIGGTQEGGEEKVSERLEEEKAEARRQQEKEQTEIWEERGEEAEKKQKMHQALELLIDVSSGGTSLVGSKLVKFVLPQVSSLKIKIVFLLIILLLVVFGAVIVFKIVNAMQTCTDFNWTDLIGPKIYYAIYDKGIYKCLYQNIAPLVSK